MNYVRLASNDPDRTCPGQNPHQPTYEQLRSGSPLSSCAVLEEVLVGPGVQAANRCARGLADLTRGVDQLAVGLEVPGMAAGAPVVTERYSVKTQTTIWPEPSMAGLQSNSGTGMDSLELSITSAVLARRGLISLCPG